MKIREEGTQTAGSEKMLNLRLVILPLTLIILLPFLLYLTLLWLTGALTFLVLPLLLALALYSLKPLLHQVWEKLKMKAAKQHVFLAYAFLGTYLFKSVLSDAENWLLPCFS